jgi:hypothetical protein
MIFLKCFEISINKERERAWNNGEQRADRSLDVLGVTVNA